MNFCSLINKIIKGRQKLSKEVCDWPDNTTNVINGLDTYRKTPCDVMLTIDKQTEHQ